MNKSLKRLFLTLVLVTVSQSFFAQVAPPPPPPVGLPIDGGILFLVISGLVYGVCKIKKD
ncbi:PID-CTERM protein-sorting domain-containing protein [Urechidicola sp. KH5]